MAAVNSVSGARLGLSALRPRAVLMCGALGAEGVALQLRGAGEVAVSCQDPALLADLLATLHAGTGESATATFDLLDSSSCHEMALSPQLASDAFLTDTSDSLPLADQDQGGENGTAGSRFASRRLRPKAASPSRQGPQQCQVCNKIFGNASALAKHKLTHSDERKYVCSMCAKAFKRQDHLNGHMLTHRNKKPYECRAEGCGKSYCDARSLRRHAENHHGAPATGSASSPHGSTCIQYAAGAREGGRSESGSRTSPSRGSPARRRDSPAGASPPPSKAAKLPNETSPGHPRSSSSAQVNGHTSVHHNKHTSSHHSSSTNSKTSSSHSHHKTTSSNPQTKPSGTTSSSSSTTQRGQTSNTQSKSHHTSKTSGQGSQSSQQSGQSGQSGQQSGQSGQSSGQSGASNGTSGSGGGADGGSSPPRPARPLNVQRPPRTWNMQAQQSQQRSSSSVRSPPAPAVRTPPDQKPVECNLCHRKFKNVPALNGHMRLHGGYFKKEAESKKAEKKETTGPPLQTASVSVRALIEEKIISRRAAPAAALEASTSSTSVTNTTTSSCPTTSTSTAPRPSFVAPAPPLPPSVSTPTSSASSSSSSSSPNPVSVQIKQQPPSPAPSPDFLPPPRNPATPTQKDATLIELLKRGTKVSVKRSASDPGHQSPGSVQLSFQQAEFTLTSMSFQSDEGGYFSPSLQDEVYQVQDPAILLQQSSTDSLQFTSASEQLDDLASLEDYASVTASLQDQSPIQYPVNQQLQAVLNSPLPESLADFSTYHSTVAETTANTKDVLGFQKEYIMYANSPHVGLSAPSPLPSPLKYHDSPSFTYPTPPASHEAQSPSLSQGTIQSLPILSPSTVGQTTDSFIEPVISHTTDVDEVRNTSSPLSAAFFTTTMSSAEEVEEALEEVLPGESIVHGDPLDMYGLSNPSPPPQSPMCVTPLPSPLSNQQGNINSPCTQAFIPSGNITFPRQTLQTLQSQMMPNSEDPLLSSSPKDFGSKKKFDFGGYQSYKIISHGPIDLNNPNLTGILVESNGEYKLIQAASNQLPVSWLTSATHQIISKESIPQIQTVKQGVIKSGNPAALQQTGPVEQIDLSNSGIVTTVKIEVDAIKEEITPSGSPQRTSRKRPRSEVSGTFFQNQHQSRLRHSNDDFFTPPPMLNPIRVAPGLYNEVNPSGSQTPCSHQLLENIKQENEERRTPRINVGPQFQATIPDRNPEESKFNRDPSYEHLLWDPGINETLDDNEVRMFMELAVCAAMPVGGHSREHALHVLGQCGGDVHAATLKLMSAARGATSSPGHAERWAPDEVETFLQALREHDKDFFRISQQIGTKSSKQCIQFYYFWKKVTKDYKALYLRSWSPDRVGERLESQSWSRWSGSLSSRGGRPPSTPPGTPATDSGDEFPCKLCGKVFNKVKSRSAHMKSHRPLDAESKKPKVEKGEKLPSLDDKHGSSPDNHSKPQP